MRRRSFLQLGLGAALAPACARAARPPARVLSRLALSHPDPRFGGFSALHLGANGQDALLMGDRGVLAALRLTRDAEGRLTGAEVLSLKDLPGRQSRPLQGQERDSEGLALAPDGSLFVSFEGANGGRIWRYPSGLGAPVAIKSSTELSHMGRNTGFEGLALDRAGRLIAIPEDDPSDSYPLWRLESAGWRIIGRLPKQGAYRPVALDMDADGTLWLLERRFSLPLLFSSRLSRIATPEAPSRDTLWQSPLGLFGNLEGLSMGKDAQGRLRATMVSDNNQLELLRSELVEVLIEP